MSKLKVANDVLAEKFCKSCSQVKPISEFYVSRTNKSGIGPYCKICEKNRRKARYWADPEYTRKVNKAWRDRSNNGKRRHLKNRYGIDLEQFELMLKEQNNKCAICGIDHKDTPKGLYVDHRHDDNKIRGLLCMMCNFSVGALKEDIVLFESAIRYLKKYGN